jgi:hypothetical protein
LNHVATRGTIYIFFNFFFTVSETARHRESLKKESVFNGCMYANHIGERMLLFHTKSDSSAADACGRSCGAVNARQVQHRCNGPDYCTRSYGQWKELFYFSSSGLIVNFYNCIQRICTEKHFN